MSEQQEPSLAQLVMPPRRPSPFLETPPAVAAENREIPSPQRDWTWQVAQDTQALEPIPNDIPPPIPQFIAERVSFGPPTTRSPAIQLEALKKDMTAAKLKLENLQRCSDALTTNNNSQPTSYANVSVALSGTSLPVSLGANPDSSEGRLLAAISDYLLDEILRLEESIKAIRREMHKAVEQI